MKLGQMLLRDGRLTEEQLQRSLAKQARDGGRLGTVMVEMGLIDLDSVTVYLGLELGIPIATRATLDRAKRSAVALLTPQQAMRYRCVPIVVQDRHLIAAVDDPHDIQTLDELSRITGYRLLPRVAPEMRIYYYLERYYGVPRPGRFSQYGGEPATNQPNLPAPPLPGLPPPTEHPLPQVPSRPIEVVRSRSRIASSAEDHARAVRDEAEKLEEVLRKDDAIQAELVPRASSTGGGDFDNTPTMEIDIPNSYDAIDIDGAMDAMRAASRRGDVVDALMSFAVGLFDTVALCKARDNIAFGWKANGPTVDGERIETLLIPLDMPSMFQIALHNDNVYHAAPFPATLHSYLYKVLRCSSPDVATVMVITIGRRVVNLLYGHRSEREPLSDEELDNLKKVCAAASDAYVRLIASHKRSGGALDSSSPGMLLPERRSDDYT